MAYNETIKMLNTRIGKMKSWWDSAIYLNYDPNAVLVLTLRGEYFDDEVAVAGPGTDIFDVTLSGNIRLNNLTVIPEFRAEAAGNAIFFKNSDSNFSSAKTSCSLILAATYHFTTSKITRLQQ